MGHSRKKDIVVVACEWVTDLADILTAGNYTCTTPLCPRARLSTDTHSACFVRTRTTQTPSQSTPLARVHSPMLIP